MILLLLDSGIISKVDYDIQSLFLQDYVCEFDKKYSSKIKFLSDQQYDFDSERVFFDYNKQLLYCNNIEVNMKIVFPNIRLISPQKNNFDFKTRQKRIDIMFKLSKKYDSSLNNNSIFLIKYYK